jgi:Flp pilus assembly protein TadD
MSNPESEAVEGAAIDAGEGLLRAAQATRPGDFWLNFYLGEMLVATNRPEEAEAFFRAALAMRPDSSVARYTVGLVLERRSQLEEAAELYRQAIELDPGNVCPHYSLGTLLELQDRLPEAAACYRKVIELDPKDPEPHLNLARTLLALEEYPEALEAARRAVKTLPTGTDREEAKDLVYRAGLGQRLVATLARADHGKRTASRDGEVKARWRRQALAWLRAELVAHSGNSDDSSESGSEARHQLEPWPGDEGLGAVSDAEALARLPKPERKEWEAFWAQVRTLLAGDAASQHDDTARGDEITPEEQRWLDKMLKSYGISEDDKQAAREMRDWWPTATHAERKAKYDEFMKGGQGEPTYPVSPEEQKWLDEMVKAFKNQDDEQGAKDLQVDWPKTSPAHRKEAYDQFKRGRE